MEVAVETLLLGNFGEYIRNKKSYERECILWFMATRDVLKVFICTCVYTISYSVTTGSRGNEFVVRTTKPVKNH